MVQAAQPAMAAEPMSAAPTEPRLAPTPAVMPQPEPMPSAPVPEVAPEAAAGEPTVDEKLFELLKHMNAPETMAGEREKRLIRDLVAGYLPEASVVVQRQVIHRLTHMQAPPKALLRAALELQNEEFTSALIAQAHMPMDILLKLARTQPPHVLKHFLARSVLPELVVAALCQRLPAKQLCNLLRREDISIHRQFFQKYHR
jgi:uncharacterized protein (DUF2336 family)